MTQTSAFNDPSSAAGRPTEPVPLAGPGGLPFLELSNGFGRATVCLQGGQVVEWHPAGQAEPVLWVSDAAQYGPGKRIRGGIPVCWPWFGAHATDPSGAAHGFARNRTWEARALRRLPGGGTQLVIALPDDPSLRSLWPHAFGLELHVALGTTLEVVLQTRNPGPDPFTFSEALHTYFRVGDIEAATVTGLDGATYSDSADGGQRKRQCGPVRFEGEVDRVFVDSEGDCAIVDPVLGRRIVIAKSGSRSTVVWNPWPAKAQRLGDLGAGRAGRGGWREMVCVESGNALDNVVTLGPGEAHRLVARYAVEAL